jgi:hypothetical protein
MMFSEQNGGGMEELSFWEVEWLVFDHETGVASEPFTITVRALDADHAIAVTSGMADPDNEELFGTLELELRGAREVDVTERTTS